MPPKAKLALGAKKPIVKENDMGRQQTIQRNAATEVVVKVNQKQSLNIVQTSVAASLSTILFIKNIFPLNYFEHRSYSFQSPDFAYKVTPADGQALHRQAEDETTVTWDMLVPGKHKHVDKMLYWLDGIGEAIKLQYLASFVISIHEGRIAPDTLNEAYVLNFSYNGSEQQPQVGFTIGNETVDNTLQTQQDMKTLFQRLLRLANAKKADIPANPAIGMQLTYNNTCPQDYEPPGFRAAPPSKWIDETGATVVGAMDGGYHKFEMRMIQPPILLAVAAMGTNSPHVLASELIPDFSSPIHAAKAVRMAPLPPKMPHDPKKDFNIDSSPPRSQYSESEVGTPRRGPRGEVHHMIPYNQAAVFDTQLAGGASHRQQAPFGTDQSISVDKGHLSGQGKNNTAKGRVVTFKKAARLSIESLISNTSLPPARRRANCVCGKDKEDEGYACQSCGLLQHMKCYGLIVGDTLKTFFCYSCLLKKDQPLLRQMKEVCQLRGLLTIIASEGYPLTEGELAKPTGYLVKEVHAASVKLVEQGYLSKVHRPNEKKAKAFRKGPLLPPFEFDEAQRERLLREYWNPAYKVEAFVQVFTRTELSSMMTQSKDRMKDSVISPTPPSSKQQPALKQPAATSAPSKPTVMSLDDDDDDDDDDLSASRRGGNFTDAKGSSSRTGSPDGNQMQPMPKKRKGDDLGEQGRGKKMIKTSEPNSPCPLHQ